MGRIGGAKQQKKSKIKKFGGTAESSETDLKEMLKWKTRKYTRARQRKECIARRHRKRNKTPEKDCPQHPNCAEMKGIKRKKAKRKKRRGVQEQKNSHARTRGKGIEHRRQYENRGEEQGTEAKDRTFF